MLFLAAMALGNNPDEGVSKPTPLNLQLNDNDNVSTGTGQTSTEENFSVDSAYAVDDDYWRGIRLAEEYFSQGVAANQEASWEEAQYYLERALAVMADLDVDTAGASAEAKRYAQLLNEIVADYRLTLLSLGSLPEDASPSAFLEKFSSMTTFPGDSTILNVPSEEKGVTYNVPIVMNDKVKKSIIYFQTVARDAFERYLARSGKYIPLMTQILKQYDLPSDIVYLPLIESGFNCKAYSWARASGPWQFIASTGKEYGLRRNWWYDERRDFVKSTHSAARFLKYLYQQFGSWELALAAYNGGPGRIQRTIERQNTTNFWDMDLRQQTEDYVPFYMAATIIAKNPEKYGFKINYDDPIAFDVVEVNKSLSLKTVAKLTGATVNDIKELNPELLREVTPPQTKNYRLRIPTESRARFLAALPGTTATPESNMVRHTIGKGETVSSIASKYGVSQYAILEANNLDKKARLIAGKNLIIPVPSAGDVAEGPAPVKRQTSGDHSYLVRAGDNLTEIARSFDTSPEALRGLNYLGSSSRIYVGQVLRLPGERAADKPRVRPESKDKAPAKETTTYVVKDGDTLWDIARQLGTSTATLRRLNGLSRSARLFVGQKLLVTGTDLLSSTANHIIYIVKRGDTLQDIARAFGTTVQAIMQLNNIESARDLDIGTRLKIQKR